MIFGVDAITVSGAQTVTGRKSFDDFPIVNNSASAQAILLNGIGVGALPTLSQRRALGTRDAPQAVTGNATVGGINLLSHDGAAFATVASIRAVAQTTHSPTNRATRLEFYTTNSSEVAQRLAVTVRSDGIFEAVYGLRATGGVFGLPAYTVATLPSAATAGQMAYASNGRVGIEMGGAGTGCPVYSKGGIWLRFDTNTQVQA